MTMMRRSLSRFLATVMVCAVCVQAVIRGETVAHFAITSMSLDRPDGGFEALKGWRDVVGVAAAARDPAGLPSGKSDQDALGRQRNALEAFIAVKPFSPTQWVALADADLSLDEPLERTVRAYEMAQLTGPYEGYAMPRRAILGVLLWEKLDPDERIGAARDLVLADFSTSQQIVMRGILSAKGAAARDAIRFQMLQIEGLQADRLDKLGLH
jgi:hypothetical protein